MNNSFENCVSDICGLEIASLVKEGKYTVFGNAVAVVEGHGGISDYTTEKVSFRFKKGVLEVSGTELKIRCLERHYAVVCGNVQGVAVKNA